MRLLGGGHLGRGQEAGVGVGTAPPGRPLWQKDLPMDRSERSWVCSGRWVDQERGGLGGTIRDKGQE
jgi:hypothetical protein